MKVIKGRLGVDPERRAARIRSAGEKPKSPSRVARQIALAHLVEDLVESGMIKSYSEIARRLGVTNARMVQVTDLILLAPDIQERVLLGELEIEAKPAQRITRSASWSEQRRRLGQ